MLTSRDQLLNNHEEFRQLVLEHTQYEQRLDSLTQKRFLTDDEKLEEVRLKKLKLRLKDQMQNIERQFQQGRTKPSRVMFSGSRRGLGPPRELPSP